MRNKDFDPNKGEVLRSEIRMRSKNFKKNIETAISSADEAAKTIRFNYVNFETGSARLTANSKYELKLLLRSRWIQLLSVVVLFLFGFSLYSIILAEPII